MVKMILNISLATKMLKNRPLCIFLPRISAYRKAFDKTKYKSFFDKRWLEKYNEIWETLETVGKKIW